jgi:hypothetical protein
MRKPLPLIFMLVLLATLATPVAAYKEPVHEEITRHAFARLALQFPQLLGVSSEHRVHDRTLREWAQRGSFDEDAYWSSAIIPRSAHHFFDPIHEKGLTWGDWPLCFEDGVRADHWSGSAGPVILNGYDIEDAKLHYLDALKGPNPGTRDVALRELFYALGHAVHLVQDMAQPEHTRNDQHLPFLPFRATAASIYENWGLANLVPQVHEGTPTPPIVDYGGYPTVKLPDYASYFHTPERDPSGWSLGRGLADFANRSFVTQDTNYDDYFGTFLRCYDYPYPRLDEATGRTRLVSRAVRDEDGYCCTTVEFEESVFESRFPDYITGTIETDPAHTFASSMNLETARYDARRTFYSLGDESYLTRASMLIPRAVGYSAGLIEHFFRGKIDAVWAKQTNGTYNARITNRSEETIGPDAWFLALFRADPSYFGRDTRDDTGWIESKPLSELIPGFAGIAPGQSVVVSGLNPIQLRPEDSIVDFERRVLIYGTLGSEAGAVSTLVQPPYSNGNSGERVLITFSESGLGPFDEARVRSISVKGARFDGGELASGGSTQNPRYASGSNCWGCGSVSIRVPRGSTDVTFDLFGYGKPFGGFNNHTPLSVSVDGQFFEIPPLVWQTLTIPFTSSGQITIGFHPQSYSFSIHVDNVGFTRP